MAADDMSTCFIFQSVDIGMVLRTTRLSFHLDQTCTRDNKKLFAHEIYRFACLPDVLDVRRYEQTIKRYHIFAHDL